MQTCWLKLKKPCKKAQEVKKLYIQQGSIDSSILRFEEANMVEENDSDSECCTEEHYNNELPEMSNHLTRKQRLIAWNVQLLAEYLKQIVTSRHTRDAEDVRGLELLLTKNSTALDEVQDVVDCNRSKKRHSFGYKCKNSAQDKSDLPPKVMSQLHTYISCLAELYGDNAFHNVSSCGVVSFLPCLLFINTYLSHLLLPAFLLAVFTCFACSRGCPKDVRSDFQEREFYGRI